MLVYKKIICKYNNYYGTEIILILPVLVILNWSHLAEIVLQATERVCLPWHNG